MPAEPSAQRAWIDSSLEALITSLEEAWEGGGAPLFEEFVARLQQWPAEERPRVFEELVAVDLEFQ